MAEIEREPIDLGDGSVMFDDDHTHSDIIRYVMADLGVADTVALVTVIAQEKGWRPNND